jgi:hypothetical protein
MTEDAKPGFVISAAAKRAIASDQDVSDAVQLTLAQLGIGRARDVQSDPEPQRGGDADGFDFGFDTGDGGDSLF